MSNKSKKEFALSQAKKDNVLELSVEDVKLLKHCYNRAVKSKQYQFTFYNKQMVTTYAKYILEYIEEQTKLKEDEKVIDN